MTSLINLKANKGQGLLETVLVLPVALAFISVLIFASYRALAYFYADTILHEAMICTDADATSKCESEFERQIQKILLGKETVKITLNKRGGGRSYRLNGKVMITPKAVSKDSPFKEFWSVPIKIQKEMKFPLRG